MNDSDLKDLSDDQLRQLRGLLDGHRTEFGLNMPHLYAEDDEVHSILDVVNDNVSHVVGQLLEEYLGMVDFQLEQRKAAS